MKQRKRSRHRSAQHNSAGFEGSLNETPFHIYFSLRGDRVHLTFSLLAKFGCRLATSVYLRDCSDENEQHTNECVFSKQQVGSKLPKVELEGFRPVEPDIEVELNDGVGDL